MAKTQAHQVYKLDDGTVVPGVTTIIDQLGWNKNVLIAWARRTALEGKDPDKVKQQAADIGTIAHAMIEAFLKMTGMEFLSEYAPADVEKATMAFESFRDWWGKQSLAYVSSELQLVNKVYEYGGTVDMVAREGENVYHLIDFKTSSGIYDEYIVQVAAYAALCNMTSKDGSEISKCHIIKMSKEDGSLQQYTLSDQQIEWGWDVFKHALALYNLKKTMKPEGVI